MTQAPPPPHEAVERLEDGRHLTCEIVMGMRVAGYRWKQPVLDTFSWGFASHWSTPGEHREAERLFTEADVRAHLRQVEEREAVMREALKPFAALAEKYIEGDYGFRLESTRQRPAFTRVDVERARTALTHSPETDGEG